MKGGLIFLSIGWMMGCGGLAQTKIERIGPEGEDEGSYRAIAVSDDGAVVVGEKSVFGEDGLTRFQAFRWTQVTGLRWISAGGSGIQPPRDKFFFPESMTADGASLYGTIWAGGGSLTFPEGPITWSFKDGFKEVGTLGVSVVPSLSINEDGSVLFLLEGRPADAEGYWLGLRIKILKDTGSWKAVEVLEEVGLVMVSRIKSGGDGTAFVLSGWEYPQNASSLFWKKGEGLRKLPQAEAEGKVRSPLAMGISRDGTCVVGLTESLDDVGSHRAFRWNQAGGLRDLGVLPNQTTSEARAVNGNGSIVVGSSGDRAFFWTEKSGMRDLQGYLEELGLDMTEWQLSDANVISPDGRVIVGDGEYQGSKSIFLITGLPPLTEVEAVGPSLTAFLQGESDVVASVSSYVFSFLVLSWMAWYLGFRRKA